MVLLKRPFYLKETWRYFEQDRFDLEDQKQPILDLEAVPTLLAETKNDKKDLFDINVLLKETWSKTKLRQPTGQTFFPTFPKEFSHFLQT